MNGNQRTVMLCKEEGCRKLLAPWNKSEYCRQHAQRNWKRTRQKELVIKNICIDCWKVKGKRVNCPHCNKVVKYMIRCKRCLDRQKGYRLKHKEKING